VVLREVPEYARTYAKFCLGRFVDHLIEAGGATAPQPPAKKLTALDRLGEEYKTYLRRQRGLAESTIDNCSYYMERFLAFRFGNELGDLNAITPDDIVAFLRRLKAESRRYKALPSHLRGLFKFLFWSGKTRRNLANSLPRVAQPKANNLPRHLNPEEIRRLIEAVRTNDAIGRRNYAMLLLMARLGLRAPEVIAIQLDDVDWRAGEILIRGKGKLHDRMPLPADAGEAVVDYIKNGRKGDSRTLFVAAKTPHPPFKDAQILNTLLRDAFERTRLKPPQKYVGSHLLRHSLATDMLRKGASLERDRRCTAPSIAHDDHDLRKVRHRWAAGDRTALACWERRSMTPLTARLKHYIAIRRSLGYDLSFAERVLRRFTAFADSEGADHITVDLFLRWKKHFGSANNHTWSARLGMVRVFASWLQGFDPRTEIPPPGLISGKLRRPRPYIYADDEVAAIVTEAARLPSSYGLRDGPVRHSSG
jgi:integrase/recombinase XerD